METVLNILLIRFGVIALGIVVLALAAVAVLAMIRRSARPGSRERVGSMLRSASSFVDDRSSAPGAGTRRRVAGAVARRVVDAAADRMDEPARRGSRS